MLKLNAAYSKKVPADSQYSSQSYHCNQCGYDFAA